MKSDIMSPDEAITKAYDEALDKEKKLVSIGNKLEKGENCEVCNKFVEGFKYEMCCNGRECGCGGIPAEPCICSDECWDRYSEK